MTASGSPQPGARTGILRPEARWVRANPPDPAVVALLTQELLLPESVCTLLIARGYADPVAAKRFLRPRLEDLEAPESLYDLPRATDRIASAIKRGETIFVHGDYDVDGMSSTALLVRTLRTLGAASVVPFVPDRLTDGYDLGNAGVAAAKRAGATVVVTCDCGTSAHDAVNALNQSGIDVIITDHHLPGGPLPDAYAICNPRRPGCTSADKNLAGAGVAYKLALSLCDAMGVTRNIAQRHLDLVALATVADVAPLTGENRVMVRYGLRLLAETDKPGLRALIRSSRLEGKQLTAGRVGFVLAPRLNAAGRVGSASLGLELLLADDEHTANSIARDLEELNAERQGIDRQVYSDAMRMVESADMSDRWAFVLAKEGWHPGVIGVVASRIVEQTARPCVLVAIEDGVGKGSGRSISRFNLHAALTGCSDLFQRFGGHRVAAGLTMDAALIPAFAERFDTIARNSLTVDDLTPELRVDLDLSLPQIDEELEKVLRHFEPAGIGNPAPVFSAEGVTIAARPRKIGNDGLKLVLGTGDDTIEAVGWGMAAHAAGLSSGEPFSIAFKLEREEYRGVSRLQLRLSDIRR